MPQNITDVDTFTDPIVEPAGSDSANRASIHTALQGLANRTRHLANRIGIGTGKTVVIPAANFVLFNASTQTWEIFSAASIRSIVNTGIAYVSLAHYVPPGADITAIEALVTPGSARTLANRLAFYGTQDLLDWSTPAFTASGLLVAEVFPDDGTTNVQVVDILGSGTGTPLPYTQDDDAPLQIVVKAGNDGASNQDLFHALRVTFDWE